jgi:large subunit ribosomal protein L17
LGRTTAHRASTLRNLAAGLFEHGQIVTTIPRAKAVQPMVEKIITLARTGTLAARRNVIAKMGRDRMIFEWLYLAKKPSESETATVNKLRDQHKQFFDLPDSSTVERNRYGELRKAPKLVKHIFDTVAPKYADRAGGYTRIVKLGRHRIGDAGELCVLQLCGNEEGAEIGGQPSKRRRIADKRTAFYAKLKSGKTEEAKG